VQEEVPDLGVRTVCKYSDTLIDVHRMNRIAIPGQWVKLLQEPLCHFITGRLS